MVGVGRLVIVGIFKILDLSAVFTELLESVGVQSDEKHTPWPS
jgi:hypothetical protein